MGNLILLCLSSLLRIGEGLQLTWGDIYLPNDLFFADSISAGAAKQEWSNTFHSCCGRWWTFSDLYVLSMAEIQNDVFFDLRIINIALSLVRASRSWACR